MKKWCKSMTCLAAALLCACFGSISARAEAKVTQVYWTGSTGALLKSDGSLWTWGRNDHGQLGDGTCIDKSEPVKVSGLGKVKQVSLMSVASGLSAAITEDGSLYTWGDNLYGLGDADAPYPEVKYRSVPGKIYSNVADVYLRTAGQVAFVTNDGGLYNWTRFSNNWPWAPQQHDTPTLMLEGVKKARWGAQFSAILMEDGSLWTCGENSDGQLGNGTQKNSDKLVKVLDNVSDMALGYYHMLALKKDGSLYVWGYNNSRQAGVDTTDSVITKPTKIMSGVKAVYANGLNSAALKKDGTLWTWGINNAGQLGTGEEASTHGELPAQALTCVVSAAISGSGFSMMAVREDGSVWTWGNDSIGKPGDTVGSSRNTPVCGIVPAKKRTVTFVNGTKKVKTQTVYNLNGATAPKLQKEGYTLSWNVSFSKVEKNLTVKAVWKPKAVKKGQTATINGLKYKVTKATSSTKKKGTVQVTGVKSTKKTSYTVPETVKIGAYTYSVTELAKNSFKGCSKAKKIVLPKTVSKIGKNAFAKVSTKLTITVPKAKYSSLSKLLKKSGLNKKVKIKKK